jgi:hypothetical protein
MRGVQFLVDDDGEKTAVLIDLKKTKNFGKIFTMSPSQRPAQTSLGRRLSPSSSG